MELIIDLLLVGIFAGVTYFLAEEGPWTAILTFFSVVFAGLLAMNFFEPLAQFIDGTYPSVGIYADYVSLVGLFAGFVFLIRYGLERVSPNEIDLPTPVYHLLRWGMGLATGYVTMAILLTALHTAPLPRTFLGFNPERPNFLGISSPDKQWLAFTQHVSEGAFARRVRITNQVNKQEVLPLAFDGLRIVFPGKEKTEFLPTFILKYATRRQSIGGGGSAPPPKPAAPPPQQNSGGSGFQGPGF